MNGSRNGNCNMPIQDYGPDPLVVNMHRIATMNPNYRTALWTGNYLQVTLMSIPVGGDIGIEMHSNLDQFIRIERGYALIKMGKSKNDLSCQQRVNSNYAVVIPVGTWHNIINVGNIPLKLYSIYAPPQHPYGTIHKTKEAAQQAEHHE